MNSPIPNAQYRSIVRLDLKVRGKERKDPRYQLVAEGFEPAARALRADTVRTRGAATSAPFTSLRLSTPRWTLSAPSEFRASLWSEVCFGVELILLLRWYYQLVSNFRTSQLKTLVNSVR